MRLGLADADADESTDVGMSHPWPNNLCLGGDLPERRIPRRSDNLRETDIWRDVNTLVVGESVVLVQRLTIQRTTERVEGPRQRWTQGGGGTRSIYTQNDDGALVVVVLVVLVDCWLVVARQPTSGGTKTRCESENANFSTQYRQFG